MGNWKLLREDFDISLGLSKVWSHLVRQKTGTKQRGGKNSLRALYVTSWLRKSASLKLIILKRCPQETSGLSHSQYFNANNIYNLWSLRLLKCSGRRFQLLIAGWYPPESGNTLTYSVLWQQTEEGGALLIFLREVNFLPFTGLEVSSHFQLIRHERKSVRGFWKRLLHSYIESPKKKWLFVPLNTVVSLTKACIWNSHFAIKKETQPKGITLVRSRRTQR